VVVASSDKAYGEQDELPYTEAAPLLARHPYDASKACTDILALTYHHTYRLPVCVTRCGNFFGGGDLNWNRLVPGTVRSVLRGQRPVLRSDGSYIRDYFYVRDGALAYLHLAECMSRRPEVVGQAFNFSNEIQVSVLDMVRRILRLMGSGLEPDVRGGAQHEIKHQYLSADKAMACGRSAMRVTGRRVLITGAAGFLGASLARKCIADGHDVHLLLRQGSARWRLAGLEGRYTAHEADLCDGPVVARAVAASRPEVVYHLAAHGTHHSQRDRGLILASNVLGTAHLLEALEGHAYRAFVHAGSSSEYGHKSGPIAEGDVLEPRSTYGVAKAAATLLCQAEAARGRPAVTVRIFSAYGPWEDPRRLVSYVMGCCLHREPARVTAGSQPRDFIYADDVLALLERAAECPAARGQILHAGTGRQYTVREVVETVLALCGNGVTARWGAEDARPDEPASWVASIERTTALTGWSPSLSLEDGIRRMWAWFIKEEGHARADRGVQAGGPGHLLPAQARDAA
jgi:nucleoside-diphosphate-sugar epimerase